MKMDNELLAYETRQVEVIEVEVEKGFAGRPDGQGNMPGGNGWS